MRNNLSSEKKQKCSEFTIDQKLSRDNGWNCVGKRVKTKLQTKTEELAGKMLCLNLLSE